MADAKPTQDDHQRTIPDLLRQVKKLPGTLFVMDKGPHAVMEGCLDPGGPCVEVHDPHANPSASAP